MLVVLSLTYYCFVIDDNNCNDHFVSPEDIRKFYTNKETNRSNNNTLLSLSIKANISNLYHYLLCALVINCCFSPSGGVNRVISYG